MQYRLLMSPATFLVATTLVSGCGLADVNNGSPTATQDAGGGALSPANVASVSGGPGWLYTAGNHIYTSDGNVWHGRGANVQDTASCGACPQDSDPNEVIRRIDTLVDSWGANFVRLTLESDTGEAVLSDANYLAGIKAIVQHVGTKPNVYVMVSVWSDPSLSSQGWPTATTEKVWQKLAATFGNMPWVLYGVANEPQANYSGSQDADVWEAMNSTVQVIRTAEALAGSQQHIVAVQGTGGWARFLDYYETHPISAGNGANVAYEVHVYDPSSEFNDRFVQPAKVLPVIIGEFGPVNGSMTQNDCETLVQKARTYEVPHLAWTFHQDCAPNLLQDTSGGGCGMGMKLVPSAWGTQFKNDLSKAW